MLRKRRVLRLMILIVMRRKIKYYNLSIHYNYKMSENIKTTLVYCNRGRASVKSGNEGQFINEIPHGIKVQAGDTISVESIAVSTTGTGSEVIEIPNRIADYDYLTNKIQLETLLYINHNCLYDVMMPLKKGNGTGSAFSFYNSAAELSAHTGRYGYATSDGYDVNNNSKYIPTDAKNEASIQYSGKPLYLGSFCPNPRAGLYDPTPDNSNMYPAYQVWNFFSKKIILEVPTGYDSPANLSKTLTQSLHQANVTPNYTTLNGVIQNQPTSDEKYYDDTGSLFYPTDLI